MFNDRISQKYQGAFNNLQKMFPMLERVNGNQVVAFRGEIEGWEAMKNL